MEIREPKPLDGIWMKAAVAGSLWASVEIILGSFLHNLKVPLSGTTLSFISVYLLSAFAQVWPERGLIWRAGLICALMKSISPSAFILGPMIGIFGEALLLEISLIILGRNLAGFIIGGAIAVFSTLVQKVINLLILYGLDLLRILEGLYQFAARQFRIEEANPMHLVTAISVLYLVAGAVAALLGRHAGRKYLRRRTGFQSLERVSLTAPRMQFEGGGSQTYSLWHLGLHVVAVVLGLFLINFNYYLAAAIVCPVYAIFVIWRYRNSVRHFRKAGLWIQFLVLMLLATFLWNGIAQGVFFSMDGLVVGLKMVGRAILIIMGFSAVGVELRNPVVKSLLYDRRMSSLYQSLNLAFSVLPHILSNQPSSKSIFRKETVSFQYLFRQAEGLLEFVQQEQQRRPPVFVVTGAVRQGKTTFVQEVVNGLVRNGYSVGGFLANGIDQEGTRTGFELLDIQQSQSMPLCSTVPVEDAVRIGNYYFSDAGLSKGKELLSLEEVSGKQIIVIDELGPLEVANGGWSNAVEQLVQYSMTPQLWVVRRGILDKMLQKWPIGTARIFELGDCSVEEVVGEIQSQIGEPSGIKK